MAINSPTTFIIGAGASAEFGLPVGIRLKQEIAEIMGQQDPRKLRLFNLIENSTNRWLGLKTKKSKLKLSDKGKAISELLKSSNDTTIDNFLHQNQEDEILEKLIKISISLIILMAEHESILNGPKPQFLSDNWLSKLIDIMHSGIGKDKSLLHKKVNFIIFNYDRCVEKLFFEKFRKIFQINENDAMNIISNFRIYRPYGSLGNIFKINIDNYLPFAADINPENLINGAKRIITYHENISHLNNSTEIRNLINSSESIYFLGFSYNIENMNLLHTIEDLRQRLPRNIYGTAYNIHPENHEMISNGIKLAMLNPQFFNASQQRVIIASQSSTCSEFIDQYRYHIV